MQVRPIRPDEVEQFKEIDKAAFVVEEANSERWIEKEVLPYLQNTRALIDDEGQMRSILHLIFPRLWLGETTVAMPGVLAVATPPEFRRQGYLKQLLTTVMHELHASGYSISTLYPFYFPFYKKFGYEHVSTSKSVKVKLSQLQKFKTKTPGQWRKASPDQWETFNAIYENFCRGKFGYFTRDERWWRESRFGGKKPHTLYLWHNAQGEAQAFVIYNFRDNKEGEREMRVSRAWTTPEAYHEILAFLANHDAQTTKLEWYTSSADEIMALVDDPREVEEKLEPGYMLRILDAARAFEERSWPAGVTGAFTLALKDELLEWNNTVLRVEVSDGKAQARQLEANSVAGISCDIRQLSQLYAGFLSPLALAQIGLLQVHSQQDLALAQQVFSPVGQVPSHMPDFF